MCYLSGGAKDPKERERERERESEREIESGAVEIVGQNEGKNDNTTKEGPKKK